MRIHGVHQLQNRLGAEFRSFVVDSAQRRPANDGRRVPRVLVQVQEFLHFQLHQFQQFLVLHGVALVQKHHQRRNAHLPRQQNVLSRLRHGPVRRRHHQDRAVHLRRAGDHVLDVVGVPRAVYVRVVPRLRLVLDVRRVNRDLPRALLGRLVDVFVRRELGAPLFREHLRDRRRQRRLPVVHVTNRPHVHVRLRPVERDATLRLARHPEATPPRGPCEKGHHE
mmetsp:Transcript_25117/g.77510  ORF Transcript_25117/g.77510 Transcript_25117/m.77510 type:complete len:223 (-) Transcript_25117:26-694(-)